MKNHIKYKVLVLCLIITCINQVIVAQYFGGRNKVEYKTFNYKVYRTPHFEIYHYFNNDSVLNAIAIDAEKWYQRHLMIFKDTFKKPNPIIIYADHADFQQTTAISGIIGVGTGGVTEALKNRVVLPLMESAAQTDHVLGHELVHAFQYKILIGEDSTYNQQRSMRNLPLWFVEGMAEYLSLGSLDPFTSMWMRDAILNNDFPTLDDLTRSYKYFPYRYGQAFWAYITGVYGDTIIRRLFDLTSRYGYERAIDSVTHFNDKAFSAAWKFATKEHYKHLFPDTAERPFGNKLLDWKNSGDVNIAPSISPDGKYIIFLSEKNVFSFDLFLADAHTGKIIKQISSTVQTNNMDDFNYLESGGSWSPDNKEFVFTIFSKGRNKLMILDVDKPRNYRELDIPGIESLSNPAWSPDGKNIVVSGLVDGVNNLYLYNLSSKLVTQLTNDVHTHLEPAWSADGKSIAFATDLPYENRVDSSGKSYRLAVLDIKTDSIHVLPIFPTAENLNPQFSPDGKWIYFLSTADGFRNLYRYSLDSSKVYRLTRLLTGICGITQFTPAITIDRTTGNLVYTHYFKSKFALYQANLNDFKAEEMDPFKVDFTAAILPPMKRLSSSIVDENIAGMIKHVPVPVDSFKQVKFKSRFKLDYIGNTGGVGVGFNSYYGTGVSGGVEMLFSDIVGQYQVYTNLSINGEIYDFSGMIAFINSKHKINWGVSLSHIPYEYASYLGTDTSINNSQGQKIPAINQGYDLIRMFEDQASIFAIYPFSQTERIEASAATSLYYYRIDRYNYFTDLSGNYLGESIDRNIPTPRGSNIQELGLAYNLDNADFGLASPIRGQRFRIEVDQYLGSYSFNAFLIDYRKYFYIKPFTIAIRALHYGRYNGLTNNNLYSPLYIGYPWFVRGFDNNYISNIDADTTSKSQYRINQLFGNRIAVANLEIRVPFTGPERLCLIPSKYFFSELALFLDGGLAWNAGDKVNLNPNADITKYKVPLFSTGLSLRINLFGYIILEPYYAIPLVSDGMKYAGMGLNFLPGW